MAVFFLGQGKNQPYCSSISSIWATPFKGGHLMAPSASLVSASANAVTNRDPQWHGHGPGPSGHVPSNRKGVQTQDKSRGRSSAFTRSSLFLYRACTTKNQALLRTRTTGWTAETGARPKRVGIDMASHMDDGGPSQSGCGGARDNRYPDGLAWLHVIRLPAVNPPFPESLAGQDAWMRPSS